MSPQTYRDLCAARLDYFGLGLLLGMRGEERRRALDQIGALETRTAEPLLAALRGGDVKTAETWLRKHGVPEGPGTMQERVIAELARRALRRVAERHLRDLTNAAKLGPEAYTRWLAEHPLPAAAEEKPKLKIAT